MSTFTDAERDAQDLARLVNEDTDVTTRYGVNPKKSAPKVIREIEESANALAKNFNFTDAGFDFATGGTIETYNQLVKDSNGNYWQWQGTLPHTVTAGTDPTLSSDWKIRVFSDHDALSNRNAENSHPASAISTNDGRSVEQRLTDLPTEVSAVVTTEADRAEVAADAAAFSGRVFDDTASGIAGTLVDEYFSVPSAEDSEYLILYKHETGGVATEVKRYPSSKAVTDALTTLDTQALDLFYDSQTNLFPAANLPVRRFTGIGSFNDYADGTYQTATSGGLSISVPASGSQAIKHFFNTRNRHIGGETSISIEITTPTGNYGVGMGYINTAGEYIYYVYSQSGVAYRGVDYVETQISSGIIQPISTGDTVTVSINKGVIYFKVNGVIVFEYESNDDFIGDLIIAQYGFPAYTANLTQERDPVRDYVKTTFSENMFVEVTANTSVTAYIRGSNGNFVSYPITRVVNAGINYDCWSFIDSNEYTIDENGRLSLSGRFPNNIVSNGVQEAPWREVGASDFISGTAHGDEITQTLLLQVDGKVIDLSVSERYYCKSARFIVDSIVDSNTTPGQDLIRRKRVYDFDDTGMYIDNQNTFLNDKTFTILYHNACSYGSGVFDSYYIDKELDIKAIDGIERSVNGDFREYTLVGANCSLKTSICDIDVDGYSPRFLISASGKPYFDLVNGGVNAIAVTSGVFWRIKSKYHINTF